MDHFLYRDGELFAEDVALRDIAAQVGTPFYCYSAATLTRHFTLFDEALDGMEHLVCYAMKANSNQAVLKLLGDLGAGMDVVSGGEYRRARAAGAWARPKRRCGWPFQAASGSSTSKASQRCFCCHRWRCLWALKCR